MTQFELNGKSIAVDAPPDTPFLWVLRDHLGMTGTKFGCGVTLCRACTVHLDGAATFSCLLPLSAVQGKNNHHRGTPRARGRAVQAAWDRIQVPQCGYCQSGQVMEVIALLTKNPRPSDADIDDRDEYQLVPLRHLPAHPPGDP